MSAALLLTLALGIFNLVGGDIPATIEHYVRMLHLDMENKFITNLLSKASGVSSQELKKAGAVTFIYSVLYIIEGIGLIMGKHWAEYLTIIATAALIPLEIYELTLKLNVPRISILIVNVIIVYYLIYRLRKENVSGN